MALSVESLDSGREYLITLQDRNQDPRKVGKSFKAILVDQFDQNGKLVFKSKGRVTVVDPTEDTTNVVSLDEIRRRKDAEQAEREENELLPIERGAIQMLNVYKNEEGLLSALAANLAFKYVAVQARLREKRPEAVEFNLLNTAIGGGAVDEVTSLVPKLEAEEERIANLREDIRFSYEQAKGISALTEQQNQLSRKVRSLEEGITPEVLLNSAIGGFAAIPDQYFVTKKLEETKKMLGYTERKKSGAMRLFDPV